KQHYNKQAKYPIGQKNFSGSINFSLRRRRLLCSESQRLAARVRNQNGVRRAIIVRLIAYIRKNAADVSILLRRRKK
ncbi:MAG: hypothetical protein J1E33_07885, partial [Alistipes sp.]|nr:hypothetical protein [Alistipes sp.]